MTPRICAAAVLVLIGGASAGLASAIRYEITNLNPGPGGTALAINAAGHVAGYYFPNGFASGTHGFIFKDGVVTDIPPFGMGINCQATGINDNDVVVGWADNSTVGFTKAFTYINGTMKSLGSLGGNTSFAYGVNNSGLVIGTSRIAGNTADRAFIYSVGSASITNTDDLGTLGGTNSYGYAINDLGVCVGTSQLTGDTKSHGTSYFLGSRGDLGTLGTGDNSIVTAINENAAVGWSNLAGNSGQHAYRFTADGVTDLGVLDPNDPGPASQANGINASGEIVGWSQTIFGERKGFVYTNGVMRDLNTMIAAGSGMIIQEASAINASGQIAGRALNAAQTESYAVVLTPRTIANPTVTIAAKPKLKTKKQSLTISGSAGGEVSSVTWQLAGKASQTASGTTSWSLRTPKLKRGKKVVLTVTAHGYGGDSTPAQITIIVAPKKKG